MATTADYGLGEFTFPRGWFMIAGSGEASTTPLPLRFFGQDLVLYRGESGTAHLVEAYCPHMGAHLARNTTSWIVRDGEQIEGDSIRCPFHGWRFGPDGACNHIPYSEFVPKAARLKTFHIEEKAGIIWMWHDPEGLAPEYPLSDFGGHYGQAGWVKWEVIHLGDLDIHGIEIVDNMADYGHMMPIHGAKECVHFSNVFKGDELHQYFGTYHRTLMSDPTEVFLLDTWRRGPGILESDMKGDFPCHLLIANTPIDDGKERVWYCLMVKANDGSHAPTEAELEAVAAYHQLNLVALEQDIEVWANKRPCLNPLALPADGPYGKVRLWYRQFFNRRDKATEIHRRTDGRTVTLDRQAGTATKVA